MGTTLKASFDTRREAEMTIERLVQEFGIERTDIFVAAEGTENSAGERKEGSDTKASWPSPHGRNDAPLKGRITVSVDIGDDNHAAKVRSAFAEFGAEDVAAS